MPAEAIKTDTYENEGLLNMPDGILHPGGYKLTERLLELAMLVPDARILDVGCGFGSSVAFLQKLGFAASGVDKSRTLLEHGRNRFPNLRLVESSAENMPFEDESFDAVFFECSLSLMDVSETLTEVLRILRPNGTLLISDVFFQNEQEFGEVLLNKGFMLTHFEDMSVVFEEFIAQVIMSTGSHNTLFDCEQWAEIIKAKPKYCLAIARQRNG